MMGKRELVALLGLFSWCLVIVVWLFLAVPWVCLQFVIVVFPDHTHYFCYRQNFNFLDSFCSRGDWLEIRSVRNPEDRLCRVEANI